MNMSDSEIISITNYLGQFITTQKKETIERVLINRTRHITIILENLFQEHNASAIVRTAECFGLMDIHAIEHDYSFSTIRGMEVGSTKWVNIHKYDKTTHCIEQLRQNGYHIVATAPNGTQSIPLHKISIKAKIALLFGTEKSGLSKQALSLADQHITIPMYGFTQSFNVSVSVALSLYSITERMRNNSLSWKLHPREALLERLQWYKKSIKCSTKLEQVYLSKKVIPNIRHK